MAWLDRVTLALAALATSACPGGSDDGGEGDSDTGGTSWEVVFHNLPGALLSVWGTASDDVWVVGAAPTGDAMGPYALHWDGAAWTRIATGATASLWWVWTDGATVWMVGEQGTIVRHAVDTGTSEVMPAPTDDTLFGVYQFAENDVWAVGGDPVSGAADCTPGVVLHYDGAAWTEVAPGDAAMDCTAWFKIWGASAGDFWVVGTATDQEGGAALHNVAGAWTKVDVPLGRPLFTVHGQGSDVLAVGGSADGLVVAPQGDVLVEQTLPAPAYGLNGVYVAGGDAAVVGQLGQVWSREGGTWALDETTPAIQGDYHSVYIDPQGGVWTVGGQILITPYYNGVLAHRGTSIGEGSF